MRGNLLDARFVQAHGLGDELGGRLVGAGMDRKHHVGHGRAELERVHGVAGVALDHGGKRRHCGETLARSCRDLNGGGVIAFRNPHPTLDLALNVRVEIRVGGELGRHFRSCRDRRATVHVGVGVVAGVEIRRDARRILFFAISFDSFD